jgi:signal peptidase
MKIVKFLINSLTTIIIVVGGVFLGLYIYGIVPYIVLSGSMEPRIKTGSLSFININTDYDKILNYDIIAYRMNKTLVTHRVVDKTNDGLVTQGDNNKNQDANLTTTDNYVGKNIFWIPKAGYILKAFQTPRGKVIFGTIIILLLTSGLLLGEDKKKIIKQQE